MGSNLSLTRREGYPPSKIYLFHRKLKKIILSISMDGMNKFMLRKYRNESKIEDPKVYREKIFQKIIKKNQDSFIGKEYNFKDMKCYDDFIKNFPVTDYDFYRKYIKKILSTDEKENKNVLVCGKVAMILMTSGTSSKNACKSVPKYKGGITSIFAAISKSNIISEMKNHSGVMLKSEVKLPEVSENGLDYSTATANRGIIKNLKMMTSSFYCTPFEVLQQNFEISLFWIGYFMLCEKELTTIVGVFISGPFEQIKYLEKEFLTIVDVIENGSKSIPKDVLSETIKLEEILKYVYPNKSRAKELKDLFEKNGNKLKGIITKIWPFLKTICANHTGPFGIYKKGMESFFTEDEIAGTQKRVIFKNFTYSASEGLFGIPKAENSDTPHYVLYTGGNIFEFIDLSSEEEKVISKFEELEIGKEYELVVSTVHGFYRYKIKDIVKIVSVGEEIVVEVISRSNTLFNSHCHKINSSRFDEPVIESAKVIECDVCDYCIYQKIDEEKMIFEIFVEYSGMSDDKELVDKAGEVISEKIAEFIFPEKSNPVYTILHVIKEGSFQSFRKKKQNVEQAKTKKVIDEEFAKELKTEKYLKISGKRIEIKGIATLTLEN